MKNFQSKLLILSFICFLILCFDIAATDSSSSVKKRNQSVCLNMIIKNEKEVICRCLASLKPLIDYWIIVDTGSTDGTQELVRNFMKDIPGELHEQPWRNFEYNRNAALSLAEGKSDYILFIDADEAFSYEPEYQFPKFDKNCYHIATIKGGLKFDRALLIKSQMGFRWKGAVHEALYGPEPVCREALSGIVNVSYPDGARAKDPKKYDKDVTILEEALAQDPTDTRNTFYLAQSYKDSGNYLKAIETYQKRVDLNGWDQEIFWSLLQIAILKEILGFSSEDVIRSYYQAFQQRSTRGEPLYYLAKYYRSKDDFAACYSISKLAMQLPVSADGLFIEKWIYDYGFKLENSVAAYWLGKYDECKILSEQILSLTDLPENVRSQVGKNLIFALKKINN